MALNGLFCVDVALRTYSLSFLSLSLSVDALHCVMLFVGMYLHGVSMCDAVHVYQYSKNKNVSLPSVSCVVVAPRHCFDHVCFYNIFVTL